MYKAIPLRLSLFDHSSNSPKLFWLRIVLIPYNTLQKRTIQSLGRLYAYPLQSPQL